MAETTYDYFDLSFQEARETLSAEWEILVAEAGPGPCLLPGWLEASVGVLGSLASVRVFTLYRDGQLIGLLPYFRSCVRMLGINLRTLDMAGNLVAIHQEFVARKGEAARLLEAFLKYHADKGWDLLRVEAMVRGMDSDEALTELVRTHGYHTIGYRGESSPYLPISDSWDAFLSSRGTKFRYKVKRRAREISENPDLSVRWFVDKADWRHLLDEILYIESRSWKVCSGLDIKSRRDETQYYEKLLPFLAVNGLLFANVLYVKDRPVAYNLCYRLKSRLGQVKTSFDEEFRTLSPGIMVIESALHEAFDKGYKEFDFLGDAVDYKKFWTKDIRQHVTRLVFSNTWRGRLVGAIKCTIHRFKERNQKGLRGGE